MSMFDSEYRSREHSILGTVPETWQGSTALDGTTAPWSSAGVGSMYLYRYSDTVNTVYVKVKNSSATADWVVLSSTNQTAGRIDVPLESLRELSSSDIINAAGIGGILSKNSTPILEKVNGGTDGAMRLNWAVSNSDPVTFQFSVPADLDDTNDVVVKMRAAMEGVTDKPVITVESWWDVGDTKVADATAAITGATVATYSATIATADVPAAYTCTVNLTPGAHATAGHALYVYALWVEYTRK